MSDLEIFAFMDGAYPFVPYAGKRKSNFIDLPNENFETTLGQRAIADQVDLLVEAENLGFDGVIMSEQHNGPIGTTGNPLQMGAAVAARTSHMKIGVVGSILNAYSSPVRMAEEVAWLDNYSGGRLLFGLPMGHGMQYHSVGVMNPATARARYREAHDVLIQALSQPGPTEWQGEFFNIPYVNLWPRPLQTPHPEIFIPAGGSPETLEFVAKHHYTYLAVLTPRSAMAARLKAFRELCNEQGYETERKQVVISVGIHVAETDKQARLESEAHDLWQFQNFFLSPYHDNFPPGYVSDKAIRGMLGGGQYRSRSMNEFSFEDMVENGWLVVGSPETVASQLQELTEEAGAGRIFAALNAGSKHTWLARKAMSLFAEEVIPKLRPGGTPLWKKNPPEGYTTASEYGARVPQNAQTPQATFGDGLVDVRKAHIEELREPLESWRPTG
ncbi:MAG TPA: LLM class flavin-dependent oxidoreductase [Baekduia sp.]|nr:LLM class flavin-dependent oxidoreductase [Baekduia sp.]